MPRPLRVFGYQSHRYECPPAPNGGKQTREIVAARSVAEACRFFSATMARPVSPAVFNRWGGETGNPEEVKLALSKPGTVFWCPLDARWRRDERMQWHEAAPRPTRTP